MSADDIRAELRAALDDAVQDRDGAAVAALRAGLARIDHAEATGSADRAEAGAASADGERRRELTDHEVQFLLAAEVDEREAKAASYDRLGQPDRAERLRAEADALAPWTT